MRFKLEEFGPLIVIVIAISAALLACHTAIRSLYFYTSDNGMKFLQVVNLTFPEPSLALTYPARELISDPEFSPFVGHVIYRNGHWYSVFPLPYAALDALLYRMWGIGGLYVVPGLSLIAISILTYLLANKHLTQGKAFITSLWVVLGTPLLFYGLVNWEHALGTALVTGAIYLAWIGLQRNWGGTILVASGTVAGLACWIRPESYVFLAIGVPTLIFFIGRSRLREVSQYFIGAALGVIPLLLLNKAIYGNLLGPQVTANYGHLPSRDAIQWLQSRIEVAGAFFPIISKRWWAAFIVIVGAIFFSSMTPLSKRTRYALIGVELSSLVAFVITVAYLRKGWGIVNFVEASPWMVLVPWIVVSPTIARQPSHSQVAQPFLLLCGLFVLLVIVSSPVTGGDQWGGRLFIMVTPMWVMLAALVWGGVADYVRESLNNSAHRRLLPVTIGALLIGSVSLQVAGGIKDLALHKMSWEQLAHQTVVDLPQGSIVATNSWWIPLVLAPHFYDYNMIHVSTEVDFCRLSEALAQKGIVSIRVLSTPELLPTPDGTCDSSIVSVKEISRQLIQSWTPVLKQDYIIMLVTSQK